MFDTLPEEIINLIFNNLEENNPFKYDMGKVSFLKMDINFILSLKGVNRFFKRYIEEKKGIWVQINKNNYLESYQNIDQSSRAILDSRSSQINDLCLKKTPCHVFTWLMDNNIVLDKEVVKQQIKILDIQTTKELVRKTNEIELIVKKNPSLSINVTTDFILNQAV